MSPNELSPYEYFNKVIGLWWLVALATFIGGAIGFIFYQLHPPKYEATATYIVTIDLNRFPFVGVREDLIQYNEDMAVNTTQNILLSQEVRDQVITQLNTLGISLTHNNLIENSTIERKQDVWELRFRSEDPLQAQKIVDIWAKTGYQAMLSRQESGKAPDYITFNPPTLSLVSQEPVVYDRNKVILAGALIGFIAGVIASNLISQSPGKSIQDRQ
jgi:uncharacterized protein involved in exopolysaccharide biosynthesis